MRLPHLHWRSPPSVTQLTAQSLPSSVCFTTLLVKKKIEDSFLLVLTGSEFRREVQRTKVGGEASAERERGGGL